MDNKENKNTNKTAVKPAGKGSAETGRNNAGGSVYGAKKKQETAKRKTMGRGRTDRPVDEFDQRIVDIARVTRVMAGGKRMRFRACVAIGNKKGKVGIGLDKGADVTIAVTKAVNDAKKHMIDVPIVNSTIPHAIYLKHGAAKVLLKPAAKGKGVIAGGAVRIVLELAGVKNITSKILGTNNKVNIAKGTIKALDSLKKVEIKKAPKAKIIGDKKEAKTDKEADNYKK